MENITLKNVLDILSQKGASQLKTAQITIWNYQDLFKSRNDYKKLPLLGKGNNGNVYLIDFEGIKHAIKVIIQTRRMSQQEQIQEFFQEVVSLTQFTDRRMMTLRGISIDESEEDDLILCVITNYMSKGNLKRIIQQKQLFIDEPNPNKLFYKKLQLIQQIAEGVQVVHNSQTQHRNLKSQGILLDENDYPVINKIKTAEQIKGFIKYNIG